MCATPYLVFSFSTGVMIQTMTGARTAATAAQFPPPMTAMQLPLPTTVARLLIPTVAAGLPFPPSRRQRRGSIRREGALVSNERRDPKNQNTFIKQLPNPMWPNIGIAALSEDTFEHGNVVKLCKEDVQKACLSVLHQNWITSAQRLARQRRDDIEKNQSSCNVR